MKILHTVEFYAPSVGGMQEVVKQLSERLVKLGHEVTVATTKLPERLEKVHNGVTIEEFSIRGNLVHCMTGEVDRYREFVFNADFDVITNFAAQQWATDALIEKLDQIRTRKVFVPTGFSGLFDPAYHGYFASMGGWMKKYDANVFLSDDYRDVNFARERGVTNGVLIPNGAGEDEFLPPPSIDIRASLGIPLDHLLVLHVGSHTGLKGHAEAIRIFTRARLANATFLLVANNSSRGCARCCRWKSRLFKCLPANLRYGKRIVVVSLSREQTVAAYHAADLFLFPSNIECSPLVLFECLASRTPFLSTDVGNAAEIARWFDSGVILPTTTDRRGHARADIAGSANLLAQLSTDHKRRLSMAEQGIRTWRERFTWEKIARDYEALYQDLVGSRS